MTEKDHIVTPSSFKIENYETFFEKSPISITLLDLNGFIVHTNSAAEKIAGTSREEMIGKHFTQLSVLPLSDFDKMTKIFNELKKGKIFGPKDIQIKDKNQNLIWINIVGSLVKVEDKLLIQVLTQDITSRKQLEGNLAKSEEKYRLVAENANDLIVILNSNNNVEYINEAIHRKIMGYTNEDLIGQDVLKLVHPDDRKKVLNSMTYALKTGEGKVDARIKHKNGNYVWIESNGRTIKKRGNKTQLLIIGRDITEKVKNIKKIKVSKSRYQNLADSLPEVLFEMDLDYNLTYTNAIASKIFGYTYDDFKKGMKVFQFLDTKGKELVIEKTKSIIRGDPLEPLVLRLKKKDGTYFYANINAGPIIKEDQVIGVRSIVHDITNMKEAQKKIEESEEKFRVIAEQSLLGICIIQDESVKYVNNTLADLLGYSINEVLNWEKNEFFKTIHPEDKKKVIKLALTQDSEFKNGIRSYMARGIKKNGDIIWLETYYKRISYQNKPAYLISFIDITGKKKTQEKLKESEERYRFLFEKSPFSILLIDKNGKIADCNPSLEDLLGYNKKELIGRKYFKLPVVHEKYLPLLLKRLKIIGKGETIPPLDVELYRKDGSLIWTNIESTMVKIGNKSFIIIMGHDISEKKAVENKLKELDEIRKDFIDRASHELKTPITTIYGAYQLLDRYHREKLDRSIIEIFDMAFSATKRVKKLVDDLLDLSRLESKRLVLKKKYVDLSVLIKKCVNEVKYLMKSRNLNHELMIPNSLHITIDDSRMQLVLINLLSNAIKYTPTGGEIIIKLEKTNNSALISVKDTGIGLTKNEIGKLFKKFSKIQTPLHDDLNINSENTGLGLYIAKEIVDLHGGKIWAESKGRHKGSSFYVELPLE